MDYRYKAFISYRHQSPDQDIAKKLHTYIENYAIPGGLKKSLGVTKMGRVFRDQEELPLSSNLGDDIHEALEQSEWLICICSPRYLQSKWCLEEVRYFLSLGRRDRILTVLAEGEPEEAFPEQLRFRDTENGREEVEPLAADVRSGTVAESLKKLQNEKLRIMAPMLGVHYDDLRQRAKQRRSRLMLAASAVVILLLAAFLGQSYRNNARITDQRNAALISESKWLAQSADEASDRMTALLLYLEALPEDPDDPDRPVVDSAEAGLIRTVLSGVSDNTYRHIATIEVDDRVTEITSSNRDLYVIGKKAIQRYDTATGNYAETLPTRDEDIFGAMVAPGRGYYVFYRAGYEKYSYDSGSGYYKEYPEPSGEDYDSLRQYHGVIYGTNETAFYGDFDYLNVHGWQRMGVHVESLRVSHRDDGVIYVLNNETPGEPSVYADTTAFGVRSFQGYAIDAPSRYSTLSYMYTPNDASDSPDGDVVMGVSYSRLYFWERDSQELVTTLDSTRLDDKKNVRQAVFSPAIGSNAVAILTDGGNVYLYDYVADQVTLKLKSGFTNLCNVCWNQDGTRLLCAAGDQGAVLFSAEDGVEIQRLPCGFSVRQAAFADGDNRSGNALSDNYVLLSSSTEVSGVRIALFSLNGDEESQRYKTLIPVESRVGELALSADGSTVWVTNNGNSLVHENNPMTVFDADSGQVLAQVEEYGGKLYPFGPCMAVWNNTDNETYLRIYNVSDRTEAATLLPHYEHVLKRPSGTVYEMDKDTTIRDVFATADGKYLVVNSGDSSSTNRYDVEAYVFVYDAQTLEELWRVAVPDPYSGENATVSGTEDFTGDLYLYAFDAGNDRLLLMYGYNESGAPKYYGSSQLAFERRDARTGEVLETYVPDGAFKPLFHEEEGVMILSANDREDNIVFTMQSFEDIAADYYAARDAEEAAAAEGEEDADEPELHLGKVLQQVGDKQLIYYHYSSNTASYSQYFVLRIPRLKEAIDSARTILDGRTLTDKQRAKYFLD